MRQSVPNYFVFIERSVGYFHMERQKQAQYSGVPKRFIIVSNTEGFETAMQQQTNDTPVCLYLKSRKYGKQSIAGDIPEFAETKEDLDALLTDNSIGLLL